MDTSRKAYQGQFKFLKYLMKTQSMQKKQKQTKESLQDFERRVST